MNCKRLFVSLFTVAALVVSTSASAGLVNDVPSCYAASHLPFRSAPHQRLIYVLIDQTVQFNSSLRQSVVRNINRLLGPGTKFVVAEFSAFSQGRYLNVLHTGIIESPLTKDEAGNIPISQLPNFHACMNDQAKFSIRMADNSALQAMRKATTSLDKSDIMAALKTVSKVIRTDTAKHKVLFLVSDTLENSAVMSFYHDGTVARISPAKAIQKTKEAGMFGDFGGARVYVIGAGMLPPARTGSRAARDGYRDPITLARLKTFWTGYFKHSDANLAEFGEPALVIPVSY